MVQANSGHLSKESQKRFAIQLVKGKIDLEKSGSPGPQYVLR
jgi:hypothetical protein